MHRAVTGGGGGGPRGLSAPTGRSRRGRPVCVRHSRRAGPETARVTPSSCLVAVHEDQPLPGPTARVLMLARPGGRGPPRGTESSARPRAPGWPWPRASEETESPQSRYERQDRAPLGRAEYSALCPRASLPRLQCSSRGGTGRPPALLSGTLSAHQTLAMGGRARQTRHVHDPTPPFGTCAGTEARGPSSHLAGAGCTPPPPAAGAPHACSPRWRPGFPPRGRTPLPARPHLLPGPSQSWAAGPGPPRRARGEALLGRQPALSDSGIRCSVLGSGSGGN